MSLTSFFNTTIDRILTGGNLDKKVDVFRVTDPNRIYVENIRQFYNMSYRQAESLCDQAVREGYFEKKYAVTCPTCGKVVAVYDSIDKIPSNLECGECDTSGEEEFIFTPKPNDIIKFYKLVKK